MDLGCTKISRQTIPKRTIIIYQRGHNISTNKMLSPVFFLCSKFYSVYVCLCLCADLFLASDFSEPVKVIFIKFGTVTASDRIMHHVLIILTLTVMQGHTDLNHENNIKNKCSIISEPVQAIPIAFAVKTKGLYIFFQSDDFALHSRSQRHFKLDKCLTCTIIAIVFTFGITVDLCMVCMLMIVSTTLTLMQGHSGLAEEKSQR